MKRIITAFYLCMTVVGTQAEDYRIFTDSEGRAIEGRIVEFNSAKGLIEIERKDGKRVWVPPTVFSQDDQNYIKEWVVAYQILDDSSLHVSMKKKTLGDYGSKKDLKKGENICFEVTFDNRTETPINGLRIEYKYFIKEVGYGKREDSARKVSGSATVSKIEARKNQQILTSKVGIEETYVAKQELAGFVGGGTATYDTIYVKQKEDQLEGIWIRIYGPTVADTPTYRDISYPKDLRDKQSW